MAIFRTEGDIGILPKHEPLTTIISIGTIRIKQDGNEQKLH